MNKRYGFTLMEVIMALTVIGFIIVGILFIIKITKTDKAYNDINNAATASAQKRKAEMVITSVELAYAAAVLESGTSTPSLDSIKNKFNVQGTEWTDEGIKTNLDFTCDVDLSSNEIHVTCLDQETKRDMKYSN